MKHTREIEAKIIKVDGRDCFVLTNSAGNSRNLAPELYEQTREQIGRWLFYLNSIFGTLALSFAIGCQGTSRPILNACISLAFMLALHFFAYREFPSHLTALRSQSHPEAKALRRLIERQFLGIRAMTAAAPFMIGYIYLLFMAILAFPFFSSILIGDQSLGNWLLPNSFPKS